jgi:hypothetical protein
VRRVHPEALRLRAMTETIVGVSIIRDSVTTSIQFAIVSDFENFVRIFLVIWGRKKDLRRLSYRHWRGLSVVVFVCL